LNIDLLVNLKDQLNDTRLAPRIDLGGGNSVTKQGNRAR